MSNFDLDAWLDDYEPVITEARIVQKAALISEHTRLQQALLTARQEAKDVMHDPALVKVEAELRAVEDEIAASEKVFTFQGVGHETWQNLKRKHPPTAEQREVGDEVNLDAWAPVVVAECSRDPKITLEQAQTMMRKLPVGEFEKMFIAVRQANSEVVGPPKSVLAALIERSRQSADSQTTGLRVVSPVDDYSGTLADPQPESSETTTDA